MIKRNHTIWNSQSKNFNSGCGGGLVVSVLAFYSDDPSSIPAEVYNFFCKIVVEKNENKQKEAGVGPIFLKKRNLVQNLKLGSVLRSPKPANSIISEKNCTVRNCMNLLVMQVPRYRACKGLKSSILCTYMGGLMSLFLHTAIGHYVVEQEQEQHQQLE